MTVKEVHGGDVLVVDAGGPQEGLNVFVEPRLVPATHRVQLPGFRTGVNENSAHDHTFKMFPELF